MCHNQHFSRIDTSQLKELIIRKIGHKRAELYFDKLSKLFTLQTSKPEFHKFCIRAIGRENIPLHNRLIRSILKNACAAKSPPPKSTRKLGLDLKTTNGYRRNCLQFLYNDSFPPSPRKVRTPVNRERKVRDRQSPLGKPQSVAQKESISRAQQQHSATELHSLGSKPPVEAASVEDGEEVEQVAGSPGVQSRSPVSAPLGISINCGTARKSLSSIALSQNYHPETCQNSGELPDTRTLRSRLEQKLETEGMNTSLDCVNLLNNGLDAYLKRLIEQCMDLARSRSGHKHLNQLNGQFKQTPSISPGVSMLEFRVGMELNPQILGGDRATLLEKICLRASEE